MNYVERKYVLDHIKMVSEKLDGNIQEYCLTTTAAHEYLQQQVSGMPQIRKVHLFDKGLTCKIDLSGMLCSNILEIFLLINIVIPSLFYSVLL